jgi:hypothetical protein
VLAFVDEKCVGAGTVENFRQDLADAGLGDGHLGFSFPIALADPADVGRVTVKLENSEAIFLPPKSKVVSPSRFNQFAEVHHSLESIEWMRSRGWLTPLENTFLRSVTQLGVFEYSLVKPKSEGGTQGEIVDARAVAENYLQIAAMSIAKVDVVTTPAQSASSIIGILTSQATKPLPIVGLVSDCPGTLSIVEGSHTDISVTSEFGDAIAYTVGPDRLLFLNIFCGSQVESNLSGSSLDLYVATLA